MIPIHVALLVLFIVLLTNSALDRSANGIVINTVGVVLNLYFILLIGG